MSLLDDEIERQRRAIDYTRYRVQEMREQLASHELWVRVGGESASAREAAEWLETYHYELRSQTVGLDTLYSQQPDPELVVDPAQDQRIAVLLPLRLETRFRYLQPGAPLEEPDADPDTTSAQWRLLVRVEPDPVAMAALPPEITATEAAAVASMWNRCERSLAGDGGAEAFHLLSSQVAGPARAAYLLRTVAVTDFDGSLHPFEEYPAQRTHPPEPPLLGLPAVLQLWARTNGDLELLAQLQPDREAIVAAARLDAVLDEEGTPQRTWWNSFAAARDVGLATEITLGYDRPHLESLLCVGAAEPDDGTVQPAALFAAHADAGRLGTMAPLTATNTVAGAPTVDLGGDPTPWLELSRDAPDDVAGLSWALTGRPLLPGVRRPDTALADAAKAVGTALWPVRGQRSLKDVHRGDLATFAVGDWTQRHLHSFGPFPTLRLGDLPYGVLPVSAFDRWQSRDHEPTFEAKLLEVASAAASWLATTAEASGTAAGADAPRLLDVLGRTPTTAEYGTRSLGPTAIVAILLTALGSDALSGGAAAFLDRWNAQADLFTTLMAGQVALRRYSPVGPVQPLPGGASPATDHREVVHRYLGSTWAELATHPDVSPDPREPGHWDVEGEDGWRSPPVLARLIRHALLLTQAEITRVTAPDPPPIEYVMPMHDADQLTRDASGNPRWDEQPLVHELPRAVQDEAASTTDPHLIAAVRVFEDVRDALKRVLEAPAEPMRTALPAVLDTTGHRSDAWLSGLATRRLVEQGAAGVPLRLGAYGWVDDLEPSPDRTPPTRAGLLHAPGYPQALTAAVLRDHVVHDPADGRWRIGLHSRQVRLAATLAEQVRAGTHLSEAIGRELERRVGYVHQVLELREVFPARPEWQGRRVCDGVQVLDATRPGAPPWLADQVPWLVDEYADHLDELRTVLDTYGDLLLADAVHDVVDGRPAAARESLEAAAGLGAPPDLRVLRTQREGGTVRTRVLVALPWDPAAHALFHTDSPACTADPAVADYLTRELGPASQWTWTSAADTSVNLRDLRLEVGDTLAVPEAGLAQLAGEHLGGVPTGGTAPQKLARARQLVAALAGSVTVEQHRDALRARLGSLRGLVGDLLGLPEETGGPASISTWRWGIPVAWTWRTVFAERLREAGPSAEDATATGEELARRIRALLPPALGLPLVCPLPLPAHELAPSLDDDWLPIIAAVRPAMAAVEVAALVAEQLPWTAASSVGYSVWAPPPLSEHGFSGDTEVAVVYGPSVGTAASGDLVGLVSVDAWAETVPSARHTTWASFGYDGPRARAPQAVLVVVPPDTERPLDRDDLLGAVLDVRRQARARAFTGPMPDELSLGLPGAVVLATGNAGCTLTPTPAETP